MHRVIKGAGLAALLALAGCAPIIQPNGMAPPASTRGEGLTAFGGRVEPGHAGGGA